ncbi:MAG: cupin domain-containing protein [Opitutus sp.]|nr:cupin domain-containing protein [Opitutus sp.]
MTIRPMGSALPVNGSPRPPRKMWPAAGREPKIRVMKPLSVWRGARDEISPLRPRKIPFPGSAGFVRRLLTTVVLLLAGSPLLPGQGQNQMLVWAPMPVQPNAWIAPNKPLTRLAELRAKHASEPNWTETVVSDNLFHADYISLAPGGQTPRRFHPDNRAWWIVQDGQIRFTIEGQEPFVASKGFLVQVPHRLTYRMETVGDQPSLRLEVTIANAHTMYPLDETPAPVAGVTYIKARVATVKGSYDKANVPFIDYNQTVAGTAKPKQNQNQFIGDAHGIANIIRGDPRKQAPARDEDLGHLHVTGPEFWFILEGQMEFKIGALPALVAVQGDIVYAPANTWHRVRFAGTAMATRLAVVGYANSHVFPPTADSRD